MALLAYRSRVEKCPSERGSPLSGREESSFLEIQEDSIPGISVLVATIQSPWAQVPLSLLSTDGQMGDLDQLILLMNTKGVREW